MSMEETVMPSGGDDACARPGGVSLVVCVVVVVSSGPKASSARESVARGGTLPLILVPDAMHGPYPCRSYVAKHTPSNPAGTVCCDTLHHTAPAPAST
jgi:hypothetical protein